MSEGWFSTLRFITDEAQRSERTDPIPKPPTSDPRQDMPLSVQRQHVAPGEYVVISVADRHTELPKLTLEYPSGYSTEILERRADEELPQLFESLANNEWRRRVLAMVTSYRRAAFFPNEGQIRQIVDLDPDLPVIDFPILG